MKVGSGLLMLSGIVSVIDIPFTIMGWIPDSNNTAPVPPATDSTEITYPTLDMYFNGKNISSGEKRELIICVDDTTQGKKMDEIFPIFKNSTRHSAKDFKMIYTIKADSVTISPKESDFNLSFDGEKTYTLKYSENILPAHFYIKEPIRKIKLNGEVAHLAMNTFITYDGTPEPYSYDAKTTLLYIDSKGLESKEWIKECKRKIEKITKTMKTDIFYSSNSFDKVYDYDMNVNMTQRKGFAHRDIPKVDYPQKTYGIRLLSYQMNSDGKDIDTLTLLIENGLRQDTTINTSIVIRNDSTGETETLTKKIALNNRPDTVKFPIGKNYTYVNYKFERIGGNNEVSADNSEVSAKENNITENEDVSQNLTVRQVSILVIMFVLGVFLFSLGLNILRKNKRGEL